MPDMTLQEALQTPEVKSFLGGLIQESVDEALGDLADTVKAALEEQLPAIRESVAQEVRKDGELGDLHVEATRLIEASPLRGAAKQNLLADYGLTEQGDQLVPGRALRLIEAELDSDGKVAKTAKTVLRESVDADIKRVRNVLRESAPSLPVAPGGGSDGAGVGTSIDVENDPRIAHLRSRGLMPPAPTATT